MRTPSKMRLNLTQQKELAAQIKAVAPYTCEEFQNRFEAWQQTWFASPLAISSDPASRTHSPEFHRLIELGRQILPLIVEKLTDSDNFLALTLYDAIQPDPSLIVQHSAGDERIGLGEQGRAAAVVDAYLRGF